MAILVHMSSDIRQHKEIEVLLGELGLGEKEIAFYLDLLQHGPRPVAVLAKRAGATRTAGYDIVRSLESKGLCYASGTSYGRTIHAHPTSALHELLEEKKRSLKRIESSLSSVENLIMKHAEKPFVPHEVAYLEGVENIKKIFAMMSMPGVSHVYGVGSELELAEYVGRETLSAFHERRKRNHINFSILRAGPDRLPGDEFHNDVAYLREVRIRPKGKVRLKSQMYLFDDTIIFLNLFDRPFATVIRNAPMFVMFHSWFDFIWHASIKSVSRKDKQIIKGK